MDWFVVGRNHTGGKHGSLDHPCAANGIYGTLLVMLGVVAAVMITGRLCARFAVARYRNKHREWTDEKAREKYGHFWFTRLEAAGLLLLTVSPTTEIIEFFRHKQEASIFWILSSVTDILGMMGICMAFLWEDTSLEIPFGVLGAGVLLASDALGAYAASLLGLSESEQLGVVVLWFASSCISMAGCVSLALCYFRYPCGPRLKMYFEMTCLMLFIWAGLLEVAWGFCPVEPKSPQFFGTAGLLNLFGYSLCLGALASEDWGTEALVWRLKTPSGDGDEDSVMVPSEAERLIRKGTTVQ